MLIRAGVTPLASGNLAQVRKLVNGGSNGLKGFAKPLTTRETLLLDDLTAKGTE